MADPQVKLHFFANAAQAEAAIVGLEKKIDQLENKMKHVGGKRGGAPEASIMQQWSAGLARAAAGYASIDRLVLSIIQGNKQLIADADAAAVKLDAVSRKFTVQAGLNALGGEDAKKTILLAAQKAGVKKEFAFQAATQLVSSGLPVDDVLAGGALKDFLNFMQASNVGAGDPRSAAMAIGQFAEAQGLGKSAASFNRTERMVQRAFKGTDLQAADLGQLAAKSEGFAEALTPEETLATFNIMRQRTTPDKASTAQKIVIESLLTGFGGEKEKIKQLGRLGLSPEQIDLTGKGENITQALDLLAARLDTVGPEVQNQILAKLFGREAFAGAKGLIRDRAKIGEFVALYADEKGYEADVATATSGLAAGRQRQETRKTIRAEERAGGHAMLFDEAEAVLEERGVWWPHRKFYRMQAEAMSAIGVSPGLASQLAYGIGVRPQAEQRVEDLKKSSEELEKQTAILGRIEDALKQPQRKPVLNPQAE